MTLLLCHLRHVDVLSSVFGVIVSPKRGGRGMNGEKNRDKCKLQ